MPSGPNQKAITLSFSKRNMEVAQIIDNYKKTIIGFVQNDYICDCIRFYEKYKDKINNKSNNIDEEYIKKIVDMRFETLKQELILKYVRLDATKYECSYKILEEKANELDFDDLKED